MNIIFICSSLEPGRDGVGDYTRRLCGELIRQGHQASILALNDRNLNQTLQRSSQYDGNQEIQIFRLSSCLSWKDKAIEASVFINSINPEWLSLQYVPFGYQDKGLPFMLASNLQKICKNCKWHIMFHELWVGMNTKDSLKYVLWGSIQRQMIKSLICKLRPKVIHTQTRLYQSQLSKIGVNAIYLPLFGNIPPTQALYIDSVLTTSKQVTFVIFGSIQPNSPISSFFGELIEYAKNKKLEIKLIFVGRNGKFKKDWIKLGESMRVQFEDLGEQSHEFISQLFYAVSFGISTTPFFQIEKSSSVAAMRDHNLAVICVAQDWYPRGLNKVSKPAEYFEYKPGNLSIFIEQKRRKINSSLLFDVANQFAENLLVTT